MNTTLRQTVRGLAPTFCLALTLGIALAVAASSAVAAGPGWRACLSCHADAALSMTTARGESLPLTVVAADLAASPHRGLECRACHAGVQLDSHPSGRTVPSLDAYRTGASRACLNCHSAEKLRARSPHNAVVFEDQQLACVECHGSHGIRNVAAWKQSAAPNGYCLACHSRPLQLERADGTPLSLVVDAAKLKASVHPNHLCTDCHAGFSMSAHPAAPAGRAQRAVVAAGTCGRCHADKLRQAEGSVHFTLLRSGVAGAPTCTDCHSAHTVAPKEQFATLAGTPCRGCHAEVFAAYTGSMHGKARGSGEHFDAPLCSDCHRAHDVQGSARADLVRAACLGCHKNAPQLHATWLPNAGLHLQAVSCAACHAPQARRVVTLRLVEKGTGRQLTEREIGDLLGGQATSVLNPDGTGIDGLGLWQAMRKIEARRQGSAAKLDIDGRLEVARGVDAHRLADKTGAVRDCESCHRLGSSAFEKVALVLGRDDGRPKRFDGKTEILTDAASVIPVSRFYALGATRAKVLDWALLAGVAGGFGVIALHLTFRLRAARAHKEG
jgi:predicted CXXCH cytochrome family protein